MLRTRGFVWMNAQGTGLVLFWRRFEALVLRSQGLRLFRGQGLGLKAKLQTLNPMGFSVAALIGSPLFGNNNIGLQLRSSCIKPLFGFPVCTGTRFRV